MVIFNSYVKLPEGTCFKHVPTWFKIKPAATNAWTSAMMGISTRFRNHWQAVCCYNVGCDGEIPGIIPHLERFGPILVPFFAGKGMIQSIAIKQSLVRTQLLICLVVSTYPSEKHEFVSWDDEIPTEWKVIKLHGSKAPTSYECSKP